MNAKEIFSKIIKLGQNNNEREELYKFCKSKLDKVFDEIPRRILHSDGPKLLDCIFNGLPDNACKIKVKIIDIVLQTMRKETTSLTHCGDLISRLCLELPILPLEHLVRWSSDSVQSIVDGSDVNMIWRDILPECLNAISLHDNVKHYGSELTGVEFNVQCVHTLCQCSWTEKQLVQLTAMFKDIQLARTDHKQVVNKVCSYMVDISPDALPPLVHQLLKLCKLYNVEIVLAHLSHYFNLRLYSKLEPPPHDSESTTMEVDDIVQHSPAEMSRCLSTCLYHISQGAAEPELIRKCIKQWPKTQLLRAPFLIDLALAISDKGADFRSVCLDAIRSAIELRILDELKSKESAWVRSVLPPDVDIVSVLKVLTTESANHRQLTVVGLINLAFCLLSVSRIKPTAPTCWSHGKLILVRLCKAQPETAGHILSQLSDKMFADHSQHQYTECLYVLCKLAGAALERSPQLLEALERCAPPARVYGAVRPLLPYSARVRDALVMVCRKGLYSRDSGYRCLALSGFLTVLKYMKLSKELSSSQSGASDQFSSHSYLTQLTVDMHATSQGATITSRVRNETICLEVLTILRRCLVQDAAVKQLLYSEMYDCTKEKTALHESILELFYEHLNKYLPDDDNENSTLLFNKCIQISSTSATLTEPIGWLLYVIAQFLQVHEDESDDVLGSQGETGATFLRKKLTDIMEKLCKIDFLSEIEMDDTSLNDLTPESKAKNIKVQQILQCYEALIAYRIMQWSPHNTNANSVHTLYKAYDQILENTKGSPKTGKKAKLVNETKETVKSQKSQKTQKSQKEQSKSPKKMSNLVKDRAGPFKPLPCLWDTQLCLRILDLLYSEAVPWSSEEQRSQVRVRRDFHVWALRGVRAALAARGDARHARAHVLHGAALLHARVLHRFKDMCDFDDNTTLSCLELYKACLTHLLSQTYSLKLDDVMAGITKNTDKPPTACMAEILEQVHAALSHLEKEAEEEDLDLVRKKIYTTLVQIANLLLEIPVVPCDQLTGAALSLEQQVRGSRQAEALALLGPLLGAQLDAQLLGAVLARLAPALGRVDEDDNSSVEETSDFATIDSRSGHMVLSQVCVHLSNRFKCAEHLLSRARDLTAALSIAVHSHQQRIDRELQELYKSIVIQLCQLTTWTSDVAKLRCCIGGGSDKVLNICMRLYSLLGTFVKQLDPTMVQALRLERLLKFSGKKLSAVMDSLITYLESSQQQRNASKVLRDTKLIPRFVLEAEQFSKHVILLGTKANVNFQSYLSLGTARDFKIKAPLLQGVATTGEPKEKKEVEDDDNINDAATEILSSEDEHNSGVEHNSGDEHGDDEPTKNKRKRLS